MAFLDPIAALLGVTSSQLIIVAVACVLLVAGWYVLKAALKIASRIFAAGCFTIILAGAVLYLYFAFFG
jgi:hypothetical protein